MSADFFMVKICCDIVKNKLYLIKSTKLCTITCTKKQKCDNELKKQVQNAIIKAIALPTIMKWRNQNEKNKKNHEHCSCRTHGAFSTCRVGRWCFGSNIVRFRGVL